MSSTLPAIVVSFVAPTLVLVVLFHGLVRCVRPKPRGWAWFAGLTALALGLAVLPLQGLPLARWLAGVVDHWSVPTQALLVARVVQDFFGRELLRREDRQTAWFFGAVAGAALYPMALGLGAFDPYSLGWHFGPLLAGMGIAAVILQWRGNRFGVVLLLATVAWALGVPESGNYWDCLMDPFYFLASLGALGAKLLRRRSPQLQPPPRGSV